VRQVRDHVTKLGAKVYWDQFPSSPELVVLFLPAEAIYMAALEQDALLIDHGVKQNVLIASPLTLIALLKAAAFGWREEKLTINAEEISRLGRALHESVATLAEHLEDLRKRMDGTFSTFNRVVGSFENNVLVKARRFRELGAGSAKEIPLIDPLETVARKLDAPLFITIPIALTVTLVAALISLVAIEGGRSAGGLESRLGPKWPGLIPARKAVPEVQRIGHGLCGSLILPILELVAQEALLQDRKKKQ